MPFLENPIPLAFAHRGGKHLAGENTILTFSDAIKAGYTYIETDVRSTADGKLVLFHDPDTYRVLGKHAKISSTSYAHLIPGDNPGKENPVIPLLEDVLITFPETKFNLDVKDRMAAKKIAEIIRRTQSYDRVCVTSFSTRRLRTARADLDQRVCTGASALECLYFFLTGRRPAPDVRVLQVPLKFGKFSLITRKFLARAHNVGLVVHAWTLNETSDIQRALSLNVDGIMTDNLEGLKYELQKRNLWHPGERPTRKL